jgi:hypothetical protein
MGASAIIGGIGLATTLATTAYGMSQGGGSSGGMSYNSAGGLQAAAADRAAQKEWEMYQQGRSDLAPWRNSGTAANTQLAGLWGLPGYTAIDPTKTLQSFPGYKWGLQQGVGAMDASAASRGLALSGPQRTALDVYGQNYGLTQAWQPYVSQLNSMSQQGLGAAEQTGSWGMQTAQNMGQDYMVGANAQAQAMIQQQNAKNQTGAGWMQGIGSILGMANGAMGMGGTSGLGNWFSGLGSGGGTTNGLGGWGTGGGYDIMSQGNVGMGYYPGMFTSGMPGMADGGPARSNQPYIVGERGPEVFVPQTSGYVVPNHALPPNVPNSEFNQFAPWRNAA